MNPYEDILLMPHHRSAKRPHMTQLDRAAQFAPFAALNGYAAEITEAGRLTVSEAELMEGAAEQIDQALRQVRRELPRQPEVTVTWFVPDGRKSGGAYRTVTARVRKLLEQERVLLLSDDTTVPFAHILYMLVR